jgi:LAO/AO transport system kinase
MDRELSRRTLNKVSSLKGTGVETWVLKLVIIFASRTMAVNPLFSALRSGDRTALARAITLVESTRAGDQNDARELLRECLPHSGNAARIGITGIPGVGKSTLINVLGDRLIEEGHRVAVLAIDPSSTRSGGSILGDKTRMEKLASNDAAFIRPSPTSGSLGGVARRTRESIILCEAAGYDRVLIETVGVGQNELAVDRMTDINLLLLIGGAGDELQGIKRGIMEVADLIAITKTDSGNEARNRNAANELKQAIQLLPAREHGGRPDVLLCSANENKGIVELVKALETLTEKLGSSGATAHRRREQDRWWLRAAIEERLIEGFFTNADVLRALPDLEKAVAERTRSPFDAADELLRLAQKT